MCLTMTSIGTPKFMAKISQHYTKKYRQLKNRKTVFPKEEKAGQLVIQYQNVNSVTYIHTKRLFRLYLYIVNNRYYIHICL